MIVLLSQSSNGRLLSWVSTVDHKKIGILYICTAVFFLAIGGLEALLIRVQLLFPNNTFLSPDLFNQMFTMHGTTMVFLVGMPVLVGFQNYFVPLMIGARDVAFPRLNAMSYWLLPFGGILLYFSFMTGQAPDAGWFSYAPLSTKPYNLMPAQDYWIIGLICLGVRVGCCVHQYFRDSFAVPGTWHEFAAGAAVCLDESHDCYPDNSGFACLEFCVGDAAD